MSLTLQFILVSIVPLSFIGMVFYLWYKRGKQRKVIVRWTFALLATAVWASSVLRYYSAGIFPFLILYNWAIIGLYAFSLAALFLLMTTAHTLFAPTGSGNSAVVVSGALWLAALALDPTVCPYVIPNFTLAEQLIRHFDVWAAVWIASWLVPVVASWMLTQQVSRSLPRSLYRNQIRYWLLVLIIFAIGGIWASIQQPGQPVWQETAVLIVLLAATIGTISLTHGQLPDIQLAIRQILYRLSGTLIIFGLTWLALSLIVRHVLPNLPAETDPNLMLILIAAVFAALFMVINRLVTNLMKWIFLPSKAKRESALADYTNAVGNFPSTAQLGQIVLRYVQSSLGVDDGWMMTAEDGPGGTLILRPLSHLKESAVIPTTAVFAADSPFTTPLRQEHTPLIQYDIDALEKFDLLPENERDTLRAWQRILFMPLHAGDSLIGVLALNHKTSGEAYEQEDFDLLGSLDDHLSPIFAQVKNLAALRQLNEYAFEQNQSLIREKQYLQEFIGLYNQYVNLITPELKRPFVNIEDQLLELQNDSAQNPALQEKVTLLNQLVSNYKQPIDTLVNLAARVQMRREFHFQIIHINDAIDNAYHSLQNMADARRVTFEFDRQPDPPPIYGDLEQVQEAIKHLLHNAIKFNKIGGQIRIESDTDGSEVVVRIQDTGVGIPTERLETLWQGFTTIHRNGKNRLGMGLPLAQFIIQAHGGRLSAESNYGAGSTFVIRLPIMHQ
ncbi:MAG: hypothetical protein CSB13_05220 [Chloroflexi bacterium]|nr:MAG: hypothetical protein CSB13_05220 [Chloroflexota bacterium]